MADDVEFGPFTADSTLSDDHPMGTDPRLYSEDGGEPAAVWDTSQRLREVIERQEAWPPADDRKLLLNEMQRQLTTLGLYREIIRQYLEPADPGRTITLYVILFPGEGRDNTGIKDLNDKVLGYKRCSEFIAARQEEIKNLFPPLSTATGPRFVTVGQDYKTASIVAVGKTPQDFAKALEQLDLRLVAKLIESLDKAAGETTDRARLSEIGKLRDKLRRKGYRFDFLFGAHTLPVAGRVADVLFLLLTEALKAAGMARFAAKGEASKRFVGGVAKGRVPPPERGHDPRGRFYRPDAFQRVLAAAEVIRKLASAGPNRDQPHDFRAIYVDTVWTTTFLLFERLFYGNPDMIRDVRKRLIKPPPLRDGWKGNLDAQIQLMELWLLSLNALDYVKDFLSTEQGRYVSNYHTDALSLLEEVLDPKKPISDWSRLIRYLTCDYRLTHEPAIIQGKASEYRFYSYASDFPEQIFFAMDIRDLGVELMAYYELAQMEIVGPPPLRGFDAMVVTFESTDPTVARKRFTYDTVVDVFRSFHKEARSAGSATEAAKAFGTTLRTEGEMPRFEDSVRVMLGGDEVFVAAHPYYARCVHKIVAELAKARYKGRPLNMRTGVAYSNTPRWWRGKAPAVASGPQIPADQRKAHQRSHDKALKLATDSLSLVKPLERTQRRIERLIEMLEGNEKKKQLAPPFAKRLAALRLLDLYVRVEHAYGPELSPAMYSRVHRLLKAGEVAAALDTTLVDLVDLTGTEIDGRKLVKDSERLEKEVRDAVGTDNLHVDPLPLNKMPAWLKELLKERKDEDDKKKTA